MIVRAALVTIGDGAPPEPAACSLVIGNFDGVHLGHQSVLREAVGEARARGLVACVLTFDPHPAAVVGGAAPPMLTTLERRAELMGELGVERVYVRAFDAAFAAWQAERFAEELVARVLRARVVVVGQNFRFGAQRAGDLPLLRTLGARLGFDVRVHAIARDAEGPFSSSRARDAIAIGDLDEVGRVLGRPHSITGVVIHGDERGRTLNFPTANLDEVPEMVPDHGVYAVRVERFDAAAGQYTPLGGGVTNIGLRPSIGAGAGGPRRTIETYVLGFSGDLYGARLRLQLVARLRPEKKFASLDELRAQIAQDVALARGMLHRPGGT
jgi:riboflavin kinase/FMN adenylyltransferase